MRYLLLLPLLISFSCFSQTFEKNTIYLIGRGSISKQGLIRKFNIQHKELIHIAIGYIKNDSLSIYEISIEGGVNSRITENNWEYFKSIENNYLGVWEFKTNAKNIRKLDKEIKILIKKEISYNFDFDLETKNKMYCSQFVAYNLNKFKIFRFVPTITNLNPTYKSILKIEILSYYPVDFFIKENKFKLIYEKSNQL